MSAVALAGLVFASAAIAGTYAWSMPADFTVAGANPDHDKYGGAPWAYVDGTSSTALSALSTFKSNVQGGLAGWTDGSDTGTFVGVNPQPAAITGGSNNEDTFPAGQMVLEPTPSHAVGFRWTSPLSATVTVNAGVVSDETDPHAGMACSSLGWDTWSLERDGSPISGQSGTVPASTESPQAISASVTVSPGDTIDLVVTAGQSAGIDSACAPVEITALKLQAAGAAPTPKLGQPAAGTRITDGEPQFTGSASDAFGDESTVTVRVYQGISLDPSALSQTLTATTSATTFSVAPSPFLYDGTYSVQVEQDDVVGDSGFSPPVTFTIADPLPPISLDPLGTAPLATATPTLSGGAGTLPYDSNQIDVYIWSGTRTTGYPVRHLVAPLVAEGRWSIRVQPALADGRYVAIAAQNGPAGVIGSERVGFTIDRELPVVTLARPGNGARVSGVGLVLAGTAGTAASDARSVAIVLYRGRSAGGRSLGTLRAVVRGGRWSARWQSALARGLYTVSVTQRDQAGNVATSRPRTFTVVREEKRR